MNTNVGFLSICKGKMDPKTGVPPNKYPIAMCELFKQANEEVGMTQEKLAKKTYRRKLAVVQMESGKVEIKAWTISYL